ncbi:Uncharacterised protein [Nocardia otitidiscaviarum]|uniref:Resolvase/invertase-type recombinase catalytic domain-containing protein n=1 Tax=Nocardia otitidiscaviarum TaxID=1823 RepID=A0A378YFJ0_9NOCA|nr:hypothetical protein [Nocardia otitidiscaviarum]SUA75932.1 Uncharacterised protein [Nocardia otitidiscaviarum]
MGRSRFYLFPGGVLELRGIGTEQDDTRGIYLEFSGAQGCADHYEQRQAMGYKPTALGYSRTDVSGGRLLSDHSRIRQLAARLGYDFADMIVYDPKFGRPPLARLKAQVTRLDAEAVIVPGPEHFEGGCIPDSLVERVDVVTVTPEETHGRRSCRT